MKKTALCAILAACVAVSGCMAGLKTRAVVVFTYETPEEAPK